MPKRHRRHGTAMKREIVEAYFRGEAMRALSQKHDVCRTPIPIWVEKYERGEFDEDAVEAELLPEYETRIAALACCASPTLAQTQHFLDARETNERLIALYDKAADLCVRNPNRDVEVAVACQSMAIYGMALNERGLCRGKQDEANAFHRWHACEAGSTRFPQIGLPEGFQ